ncbi:O-antigen ligase family protein [Candidatus Cryosericum odellii]|uniref:O-antigen ligase-related domain-containing protein n=1 Tax=Candidatus Cryosericum odellii TaxID=2290917 RepID=A0A398CY34_9BACT|nr:O-antigen ligase family protein [Candidatus Cryosericum odellii]RIE07160.1 hypothetical protein SMC6_07365 [Candidatus Cryosericum odellii]RIE13607.1 hypothetical protein SMC5_02675 [Candidatus Cryosericum odellii]
MIAARSRVVSVDWNLMTGWLLGFASGFVLFEPSPFEYLTLALLFVGVLEGRLRRLQRPVLGPLSLLLTYNALAILSCANAADVTIGFRFLGITMLLELVWFFIASNGRVALRGLVYGYLAAAGATAIAVLLAELTGWSPLASRVLWGGTRALGFFKDPNVMGPWLVPAILIALDMLVGTERKRRNMSWAVFGLLVLGTIVLTGSRAGWLNAAVSLLAWAMLLRRDLHGAKARIRVLGRLVLLGLLFSSVLIGLLVRDGNLWSSLVARVSLQSYDTARFWAQQAAWRTGMTHIVIGIGPGQAELLTGMSTHSLYARAWAETGVLGFIALMSFFVYCAGKRRVGFNEDPAATRIRRICMAALAGIAVNSLYVDTIHWRHLWIIAAILTSIASTARGQANATVSRTVQTRHISWR